ncbi:MAG: hypothetical protein ACOCV2_14170 [Persicimonas sp.]
MSLLFFASPAAAQITVFESEDEETYLDLGGYAQSVTGVQVLPYEEVPFLSDDPRGINSQVVRLEWDGQLTDSVGFAVHNRLYSQIVTGDQLLDGEETGPVGLGASVAPDRTLDLSTEIVDETGLLIDHDIDRAAFDFFTESADITVGRQAITWGRATLFPVADLWTKFSPFELDQTQKRGTDAARALFYPSYETEIDVVVADRGSLEDLSAGVRAARTFGWGDAFVAGGKMWDQGMAMAGVSVTGNSIKGRLEVTEPFDLDESEFDLPRATVGGDYLKGKLQLSLEYHFNGAGAVEPDAYLDQLQSEVFERGETYFLGRHYMGGLVNYSGFERTDLSLSTIANVGDPSAMIAPNLRYVLSDEADISIGGFHGVGDGIDYFTDSSLVDAIEINSEYGTYGSMVFTQLRIFY